MNPFAEFHQKEQDRAATATCACTTRSGAAPPAGAHLPCPQRGHRPFLEAHTLRCCPFSLLLFGLLGSEACLSCGRGGADHSHESSRFLLSNKYGRAPSSSSTRSCCTSSFSPSCTARQPTHAPPWRSPASPGRAGLPAGHSGGAPVEEEEAAGGGEGAGGEGKTFADVLAEGVGTLVQRPPGAHQREAACARMLWPLLARILSALREQSTSILPASVWHSHQQHALSIHALDLA